MISYPTTDQIILDCRRELLEVIGPEVTSEAGRVSMQMIENVLRNVAARAAHEIAWMHDEITAMESYAQEVAQVIPGNDALTAALTALAEVSRASLHLNDVTVVYTVAGEALSCALEAALATGNNDLADRAAALLTARSATEQQIMGEWGFVGRG